MKPLLTKLEQSDKGKLSYRCPWCLLPTSSEMVRLGERGSDSFHVILCGHAECARPALVRVQAKYGEPWNLVSGQHVHQIDVYPRALPDYSADGVPEKIARDFTEALRCQASGYLFGAALVGRRVLQAAVRHCGGKGSDLKAEINSLESKLLPDLYKEQAHEVRLVGNDAAHADEVTEDEVEDLVEFTKQVLHHLYVMPEQVRAAGERRRAKKAESK